jgi:hypothetical protein
MDEAWRKDGVRMMLVGALIIAVQGLPGTGAGADGTISEGAAVPLAGEPFAPLPGLKVKTENPDYDPAVLQALDTFCTKWMGFLAERERENRAKMGWERVKTGVVGTFVGYSPDYECKLKKPHQRNGTPVATIKYIEYLYQQEGPTRNEAAETAPRAVDATEVLEIFRYAKGKWVY